MTETQESVVPEAGDLSGSVIVVGYSARAEGRAALQRALSEATLRGSSLLVVHTAPDAELSELPSDLHALIGKGSRNAYQISDEDIAALLGNGWQEDAVFEIVVAMATSAGATRYAIAMDAIDQVIG